MASDDSISPAGKGDRVVAAGDSLASLAAESGHFWETIWNDPANAELRSARSPEVLFPGDRVTIPPLREKKATVATGARHTFRRKGVPVRIGVLLRDGAGEPLPGRRYQLRVGAQRFEGTSGQDGAVIHWVDPAAKTATLRVWLELPGYPETVEWAIGLGHLNPVESVTGAQARLDNLGFSCGAEDGEVGPATRQAVQAFQRHHGLEPTGELDDATRARLTEAHGS